MPVLRKRRPSVLLWWPLKRHATRQPGASFATIHRGRKYPWSERGREIPEQRLAPSRRRASRCREWDCGL